MDDKKLQEIRSYKVVKSNEIIQKARYNLQLQEQKIILYLISKIKPEDIELKEHLFQIRDFCLVCGLDDDNGANYRYVKQTLKNLRDKSIWVTLPDGSETTLAWMDQVTIHPNSGAVKIKINDLMKPYLIQLKECFTQYELLYTLAMKSQYSIRLYELLKSYEYQHEKTFEIEELKRLLSAENYTRYADFQRFVLDRAAGEINALSDLAVAYKSIKEGKRFAQIKFTMQVKKELDEKLLTWANIDEIISPAKASLYEKINKAKKPKRKKTR
jgi:plasmid replication initiation protein